VALPDFFVVGVPKGGTTALHALLAQNPGIFLSPVKEPKFYLCDGAPPARATQRGPGDAHSAREWMWRRSDYEALFDAAPPGVPRGESTPFYLYDRSAHARMAADVPRARLIAVLRDPVDRAYSNWNHLRSDGIRRPRLSPESRATALELFADDIRDLETVTGASYADWLSPTSGGDFIGRRLPQPRSEP
jgi:sulfotransferase family protein